MTKALKPELCEYHCIGLGMIDKPLWSGSVVKVNNTNSANTLETNLNGNKQMILLERAYKMVKNKPKNS
jgi:hypothetical protein